MSTVFGPRIQPDLTTIPPNRPYDPEHLNEVHVNPPLVYVAAAFEYKEVTRANAAGLPSETELNDLGKAGWELVAVLSDGASAHFYFKRQTQ